jgi:hypothetical protein
MCCEGGADRVGLPEHEAVVFDDGHHGIGIARQQRGILLHVLEGEVELATGPQDLADIDRRSTTQHA